METRYFRSSRIKKAEFYQEENTLVLYFNDGTIYEYNEIAHSVFLKMVSAKSVGKYFNEKIRGHYDFDKIK